MNKYRLETLKEKVEELNLLVPIDVLVVGATGVGKSKIAIKLHEDLIRSNKGKNLKVLLLIAEKAHKENWKIEYKKWALLSPLFGLV